jgi:hypothetical protein
LDDGFQTLEPAVRHNASEQQRAVAREFEGCSACLIVDSASISKWQHQALFDTCERGLEITTVLWCDNTKTPKQPLNRALRLRPMSNDLTKSVPWGDLVGPRAEVIHFQSEWEGAWQRVPASVGSKIGARDVDLIVKFGMYLLRDPQDLPSRLGVLGFHHGNPPEHGGRPAGFYELMTGADSVSAMVQRLNNNLDGGDVLAFGEYKLTPHSYRRDTRTLYENSTMLLSKAIRNALRGEVLRLPTTDKNDRLPSSGTGARFVSRVGRAKLARIVYGMTREKLWQIAQTGPLDLSTAHGLHHPTITRRYPVPKGYSFVADPGVLEDGSIVCEGMDRRTGLGQLLVLDPADPRALDTSGFGPGHLSYPFVVTDNDVSYLMPEMSAIGAQHMVRVGSGPSLGSVVPLAGLEAVRLVDPTMVKHDGRWWLFAGRLGATSADHLYLWSSDELLGPYREHPDNPIVIDPSCARPAGPIVSAGGELFRCGQDNRGSYGNGIVVRKIVSLTEATYREEPHAELRMREGFGPHTLVVRDGYAVVDWYEERFNPLAWLLRAKGRVHQGRAKPGAA